MDESPIQKKLRLMLHEETQGVTSGNFNEICSKLASRFRLSQDEVREEVQKLEGQFKEISQRSMWVRRPPRV